MQTIELDITNAQVPLIMAALDSPTRRKILQLLQKNMDIIQMAHELNQTGANISSQVKILEKAGLCVPTYTAGRHGVKKIPKKNVSQLIITFR